MTISIDSSTTSPPHRSADMALLEHWMHEAAIAEMRLEDATTPAQRAEAQSRLDEAERALALFRPEPTVQP
jgi:hypothetical protein